MERNKAFEILKQHVKSESLIRHSFAVEASMKAYSRKFSEDENLWGNIGLLHDVDFELYPETHPNKTAELLVDSGLNDDFIATIVSHGHDGAKDRNTLIRKCLFAVDQMSSFIVAIALMRPTKLEGLAQKSVKKKMKDKAFAKAVDRELLTSSMQELDVEFADHVNTIVEGLKEHEQLLSIEGLSLF